MTATRETAPADWDLEVLVSPGCPGCEHSMTIVEQLRATHPNLRVKVTDVDEPGWVAPPGFVGTPMFLVRGRILSLGNPSPQALRAVLRQEDHGAGRR